ncbi:DUF308 domain-containing protein [Nonomuraea lactucae]|uniref:DUF308 domain-containing protein n=1 Tax=Nonomuraea lactucae TaxID=2249762 RepID=UPI000DE3A76B|nr:DUF308 domain-containing protein [Nonomuraea lactucae]
MPTGARRTSGSAAIAIKGLVTLLVGVAVLAQPPVTVGALAALVGLLSLVMGTLDIARSILARASVAEVRLLFALLGLLLIGVGVLALGDQLRTAEVLAIMFGLTWLLTGVIELVDLLTGLPRGGRGRELALAIVTALAGITALIPPAPSLAALTVMEGLWLIAWGCLRARFASMSPSVA